MPAVNGLALSHVDLQHLRPTRLCDMCMVSADRPFQDSCVGVSALSPSRGRCPQKARGVGPYPEMLPLSSAQRSAAIRSGCPGAAMWVLEKSRESTPNSTAVAITHTFQAALGVVSVGGVVCSKGVGVHGVFDMHESMSSGLRFAQIQLEGLGPCRGGQCARVRRAVRSAHVVSGVRLRKYCRPTSFGAPGAHTIAGREEAFRGS